MQHLCTLRGGLNVSAFSRAWQRVVDRHPILRSAFVWEQISDALQCVKHQATLLIDQQDLRTLSLDELKEFLQDYRKEDRVRGFNLTEPPLMRLGLLRTANDSYEFLWSFHHLLLDGWSAPLVLKEVFAFYNAFLRGEELQLKERPPFRNYIAWLKQQDLSEAEAFWRETLKDFTEPIRLPVDKPFDAATAPDEGYDERSVNLSAGATADLRSFARQNQLTLNTVTQATWALLLSRYSGSEDIVYGVTLSGRSAHVDNVEEIVGMLINTLPVRVQASSSEQVLPWLRQFQSRLAELQQFEHSPLVKVEAWSEVERGVPLVENIFVFENYPVDASLKELSERTSSLRIENVRAIERNNYPLSVLAVPGEELSLSITYSRNRYDDSVIERMLGHLVTLLQGMVANPGKRLSDLEMLTAHERTQLLVKWNDTTADYASNSCIQELFERQVERTPNSLAVVFEEKRLTFRELNERANQLAHYLIALGAEPEMRVGLCVDRSVEMIVGMLGILKAGAAYVPLDPTHPKARLSYLLEDATVSLLLLQEHLLKEVPDGSVRTISLDGDWESIAQGSTHNPLITTVSSNLAYVIYTSGSTGEPKGVQVEHRGVCNLAEAQFRAFKMDPDSRVINFAPSSFDASVSEIFVTLLSGATLCLGRPEIVMPGAPLIAFLREQAITTATIPPSVLAVLPGDNVPALRTVVSAGEACPPDVVARWAKGRYFLNAYGPTEATVCATIGECAAEGKKPSIGRPMANVRIYLLDAWLRPVPIRVPGEIYIAGEGLARGYLNSPGQTAERFIPNPFSNEPGKRLYRTGDLARYLADGSIEYLGRADDQVKVRGFRIEPREIEAALKQQPGIRDAVVVARGDRLEDRRLVGYLVPDGEQKISLDDVQSNLKGKLPGYMVPSVFVTIESVPLTRNGKIDRASLPAPDLARHDGEESFVAPRTPTEETLVRIWSELMGIAKISIRDNFFNLGGHSLLAVKLLSSVREEFQVALPVHQFLSKVFSADGSTIEGMARAIEEYQIEQADAGEIAAMMGELSQLSDEEVKALLATEDDFTTTS